MDRHNQLVKAACDLIAEKGFEGLRVRDVASLVQINPATVYHYFPTKEALIDAVVDYVFERLGILATESPGTPRDQFHAYLTRLYRQMRDEPGMFTVFAEIQLRAGRTAASQKYLDLETMWHKKLVALLQAGIRQGYWPNYLEPEQVATTILLTLNGAAMQASINPRSIGESIGQLERWLTGRG
ncbi:MAG: TetR/AcrR family transcriptional regulator [Leptolinea sp.]|nr:TetR/AcrR family transcriptional regulator [Leptolinea sp.]